MPTSAQQFDGALPRGRAAAALMRAQRVDKLPADGEGRIERGQRILEDHARYRRPRTPAIIALR